MKFLVFYLLVSFTANAQLIFINSKSNNNITKFIVSQDKTELYVWVEKKEILLSSWNKVPANSSSQKGQNQFKMIVVEQKKGVKITYEIQYSLFRKTNKHLGYIKTTYSYLDTRPSKITEDYFNIY